MRTTLFILLLSGTLFAQPKYPQKIVLNNDTLCVISINQLKTINTTFVQLDNCIELKDTLNSLVKKQSFAIEAQKKVIANKDEQLAISADMIKGQDIIIYDYKKVYKRDQKQIKWLKLQRNTLAIGLAIAAVKIFVIK